LLDRFSPAWKESLEQNDAQYLDAMLESALATADRGECAFTSEELDAFARVAKADAAAVASQRTERRQAFDAAPGWHIVIESGQPLWPNNFDPLNMEVVDGGLLHTRWVRVANQAGSVEALDGEGADITVFTEGPGPHPLFNGVTRVSVSTATKPVVTSDGEHVTIAAPGITIDVKTATVEESGNIVQVRLR
jgi:hypothetical protein